MKILDFEHTLENGDVINLSQKALENLAIKAIDLCAAYSEGADYGFIDSVLADMSSDLGFEDKG